MVLYGSRGERFSKQVPLAKWRSSLHCSDQKGNDRTDTEMANRKEKKTMDTAAKCTRIELEANGEMANDASYRRAHENWSWHE